MKFDCSNEFDLNLIYQKLISSCKTPTVKASNFFDKEDELTLLQQKMAIVMQYSRKNSKI